MYKVLFKRKPVQYLTRPSIANEDEEVWEIPETGEIFVNYEGYLQRTDFYKQRRFICEITGHSGLSFFDALKSEMEGSKEVDGVFPDALREPILRKVQFSTISRIDNLVDHIFDEFKQDFYPGENVTVILDNGERLNGVVREKTKFPELSRADGTLERKAFARYFVSLTNRPFEEALVDDEHIVRDRRSFTKQMLRSFIKNTVTREAWNGAPWLVKERVAHEYRISTDIPAHLHKENKFAERKANLGSKKGEYDGTILSFFSTQSRLPELKPKSHKGRMAQQDFAKTRHEQFLEYQRALSGNPGLGVLKSAPGVGEPQFVQFVHSHPHFHAIASKGSPRPLPPPPIKYPIEDLEIAPIRDVSHRPDLQFLSNHKPPEGQREANHNNAILMESVGPLLETWNTLNVFCEVFQLDSFTFDDYVEALQVYDTTVPCELLVEIHCALLKRLVNSWDDQNGSIQIPLPAWLQEVSEAEESTEEVGTRPTPEPDSEIPLGRTTRSSLAKSEVANLKASSARSPSPTIDGRKHWAKEFLTDFDWVRALRNRDLANSGWIMITIGLLYQLSHDRRHKVKCDEILAELAPLDFDAENVLPEHTAQHCYEASDINFRVKIIEILCLQALGTRAIRAYMEDCSNHMTEIRKDKIEQQRNRKNATEVLRALHEERKTLQPDERSPSPIPELEALEDSRMTGIDGDDEEVADTEDEEPNQGRSLRRGNDRAAERKRKQEEEREKKEKEKASAKLPKQSKQLAKVLKKIDEQKQIIRDCEEEIITLDNDLREADCPRTRVLGKDRFWNRYYWMERNAMPYAGMPNSSTADAGYANARIWVQGPDDMEREGFIELKEDENKQYRRAFHMTVPERKIHEEGKTHVFTARQWGYYDDTDSLDHLIGWLDSRGVRENKLRKELQAQRERITTHMLKRKEYLAAADEKKSEAGGEREPVTRISTRTKTYVEPGATYRCQAWRNTTAIHELGHLHSEPVKASGRKQTIKFTKKVEEEDGGGGGGRQTRATNRQGKPLTRQGSRYNF